MVLTRAVRLPRLAFPLKEAGLSQVYNWSGGQGFPSGKYLSYFQPRRKGRTYFWGVLFASHIDFGLVARSASSRSVYTP